MKKIMKMGLILSVLICLGSFVGCNSLNKKQVEATENKEAVEAKDTTDEKNTEIKPTKVVEFLNEMLSEYESDSSYENDLRYACYVCNTIMNMIINNIIENEYKIRISNNL